MAQPLPDMFGASAFDMDAITALLQPHLISRNTDIPALPLRDAKANLTYYCCGRLKAVAQHIRELFGATAFYRGIKDWQSPPKPVCNCSNAHQCTKDSHPVGFALHLFFPLLRVVHDLIQQLKEAKEVIRLLESRLSGIIIGCALLAHYFSCSSASCRIVCHRPDVMWSFPRRRKYLGPGYWHAPVSSTSTYSPATNTSCQPWLPSHPARRACFSGSHPCNHRSPPKSSPSAAFSQ